MPILFATNGEIVWHIDVCNPKNIACRISTFHTPDALEEFSIDDTAAGYERLLDAPSDIPRLYPFQRKAVRAVENLQPAVLPSGYRLYVVSDPLDDSASELPRFRKPVKHLDHAKREVAGRRYYDIQKEAVEVAGKAGKEGIA